MKRRTFILCLAGTAAAGLAGWRLGGSAKTAGMVKFARKGFALGTEVTLTVFHSSEKAAQAALDEAFAEINRVEDIMSLYRPESQICRLNRDGRLDNPHPYLVEVLGESRKLAEATGGTFDVTI